MYPYFTLFAYAVPESHVWEFVASIVRLPPMVPFVEGTTDNGYEKWCEEEQGSVRMK